MAPEEPNLTQLATGMIVTALVAIIAVTGGALWGSLLARWLLGP